MLHPLPPDAKRTRRLAADQEGLRAAAAILAAGGLVAFPTETVYGLGADATNGPAVAGIYAAKGRPTFNPLIVHVPDLAAAEKHARLDPLARRLGRIFWPGPLTLVLDRAPGSPVSDLALAGLPTVALRVPAREDARTLLRLLGRPVVAPSANRSGHVSATTPAHVLADLDGRIDAVVDGGPTPVGVESTIVAVEAGRLRLLRPGGLPVEAIAEAAGCTVEAGPATPGARPLAPGMLASHYAPSAAVRLDARQVEPGEALLAFGPDPLPGEDRAAVVLNLSTAGDLVQAAANLFGHLRALDGTGATSIAVAPIPGEGLGAAIRDRLQRAAAPR